MIMSSRRAPFFALCLLLDISSIGAVPVAAVQESQGFIYGRAITKSGAHFTGFVRWGDEEAFWDDLFHAAKSNQHLPKSAPYGSPSDDRDGKRVMQPVPPKARPRGGPRRSRSTVNMWRRLSHPGRRR